MLEVLDQPVQTEYFSDVIGQNGEYAEELIPMDSRLAEDDPIRKRLIDVGMRGEPVLKFEAGKQEFAIVDLTEAPKDARGNRLPFEDGFGPAEKPNPADSPKKIDPAEEGVPTLALVHFEDGNVVLRAVRPQQEILIGRNAHLRDKKSRRFDYGGDTELSRRHAQILLDPKAGVIKFASTEADNGTRLTYQTNPQPREVVEESEELAYVKEAKVLGGLAVQVEVGPQLKGEGFVANKEKGMKLGEVLEDSVNRLSRKERLSPHELKYLDELVSQGSRAVQGLVEANMELPSGGQDRLNIRELVTSARNILENNGQAEDAPRATKLYAVHQMTSQDLISILNKMGVQHVPDGAQMHERLPYEQYARNLSVLIGNLAAENNGLPITKHIAGKFERVSEAYDKAFAENV